MLEAVRMDKLILGKPMGEGCQENPEQQPLEVRWREAGKNIRVAQKKASFKMGDVI